MEKITIAKVDINYSDAVKETARLKQEMSVLEAELTKTKNTKGKLSKEYIQQNAVVGAYSDEIKKNENALKELEKSTNKNISSSERLKNTGRNLTKELRETNQQLAAMRIAGQENTKEYRDLAARGGELRDTINKVRSEVNLLSSDSKNIDMLVGSFSALASAGQAVVGVQNLIGSENEEIARGIQKMIAIQTTLNAVEKVARQLRGESIFMMTLKTAKLKALALGQIVYTKAVGASTGAMKLFRIAFLALGITAIVVAIGALIANWEKLTSWISRSKREMEFFSASIERYNALSEKKIKNIERQIELGKAQGKTERELLDLSLEKNKEQIRQTLIEIKLKEEILKRTKKDSEEYKKLEKELDELNENLTDLKIKRQVEVLNYNNKVRERNLKNEQEHQKKLRELETKRMNDRVIRQEVVLMNMQKNTEEYLNEELKLLKLKQLQELSNENLTQAQKNKIISQYTQERKKIELDYQLFLAERNFEQFNYEIEMQKRQNESLVNSKKELSESIINQEEERLNALLVLEAEKLAKQLELGKISQNEYNLAMFDLEKEKDEKIAEYRELLEEQELQKRIEKEQVEFDNRMEIARGNLFAELEMEREFLEMKYEEEIRNAERIGADTKLIEEKYSKAKKEIARTEQAAKLSLATDFANNVSNILGEQTKAGKLAGAAAVTIDSISGAMKAFNSLASIPIAGPVLGAAAAGSVIASGIQSVRKIYAVNSTSQQTPQMQPPQVQTPQVQTPSFDAEIGRGLVARATEQTQRDVVLVVDDVTDKQTDNELKEELSFS